MLKNYFNTALRSFIKNRSYTLISLLGLSVAICCCLLIMLFVKSEFSYDQYQSKAKRLYRAWIHEKEEGRNDIVSTITSLPMGPALQDKVAGVESACRICKLNTLVKYEGKSFYESVHMADTTLFRLFDFPLAEGSLQNPWPNANSLVITETLAKKYFGNKEPIGRNIELQLGEHNVMFMVSAVIKNIPPESSIKPDFLIPFSNDHFLFNERMRAAWASMASTETYVLLNKRSTRGTVEKRIPRMLKQVLGSLYPPGTFSIHLQPITDIHLDNSLPPGLEPISNPWYAYILSTIGLLILCIACINFITLSMGRSSARCREAGIRKVLGAEKKQIIFQFFSESFLLTAISAMIGLALSLIFFKPFQQLTGTDLSYPIDFSFLLFLGVLIISISFITGIYPASLALGFNPAEALKGKVKTGRSAGLFRKSLITAQFTASILMIICSWIVARQIRYLKNKDLGYQGENVVVVSTGLNAKEGLQLAALYQNVLRRLPDINSASIGMYSFNEAPWAVMGYTDDHKTYRSFEFNAVDTQFLKTMQIRLLAGNNFFSNEDSGILVNESLVKEYGWKNPVGQKLPGPFDQSIRGVMKDFNIESLHTEIKPLVLSTHFESISGKAENMLIHHAMKPKISIRLIPGNLTRQLEVLKTTWQQIAPNQEFNYTFLDEAIALQYKKEERTGAITELASCLSIFISCMGLLGLVTLVVTHRAKEIAIRKVLGANASGIITLISKDFLKLVFIAAFISFPLAWLALNHWLAHFAYRVNISWWVFGVATILVLTIALLTISIQAYQAAMANPVKNMQTE